MKYALLICLLLLISLVGCNSQSDENGNSLNADKVNQDLSEQTIATTNSVQTTPKVEAESGDNAESEIARGDEPETPTSTPEVVAETENDTMDEPTITTAQPELTSTATPTKTAQIETTKPPSKDTTPPPESTGGAPATTGGLPIKVDVEKLVPVSWLQTVQRLRFWDITNRVVAKRNEQPINFEDAEIKELAITFEQMDEFAKRMSQLHTMLETRQKLANSKMITEQLTAALRGEIELPKGTRQRRNGLKEVELPSSVMGRMDGLEAQLLENRVGKGDLFDLAIRLRGSLANFVKLREIENLQDEFFLSFPTTRLREMNTAAKTKDTWAKLTNSTFATVRELRDEVPPELKAPSPYFADTKYFVSEPGGPITALPVLTNDEFKKLATLADRIEELSGGPEPLLVFPKTDELPSRKRLVAASRRNVNAMKEADKKAFVDVRDHVVEQLDDEEKKSIKKPFKKNDEEALKYLMNSNSLSVTGLAHALDLTVRLKVDPMAILEKESFEIGEKYVQFVKQRRRKVQFVGAEYYFGDSK